LKGSIRLIPGWENPCQKRRTAFPRPGNRGAFEGSWALRGWNGEKKGKKVASAFYFFIFFFFKFNFMYFNFKNAAHLPGDLGKFVHATFYSRTTAFYYAGKRLFFVNGVLSPAAIGGIAPRPWRSMRMGHRGSPRLLTKKCIQQI